MLCTNRSCKKWYSANIFKLNTTTRLTTKKILKIFWYWSQSQNAKYTTKEAECEEKTVLQWYKKIREICTSNMKSSPPMGGPGFELQIDESLFQGKRKYHRGRLLMGDKKTQESDPNNPNEKPKNNRNYGNRVQGPWVFGIVSQKSSDIQYKKQLIQSRQERHREIIRQHVDKSIRFLQHRDKR